jgi:hypothetical protein
MAPEADSGGLEEEDQGPLRLNSDSFGGLF